MARKSLAIWIREALTDPDKDGKCTALVLCHMVGQQRVDIHTTRLSPGINRHENELEALFQDKANTYAQNLNGVQTFNLLAFYNGRTTPEAFFPFMVQPQSEGTPFGGLATEGPTESGSRQQSMRHLEMNVQQVYRRQQVQDQFAVDFIREMRSMQSDLMRHNRELMQENRDSMEIVREVLMQKALDDHNRKMEQLGFERSTLERRKWMSFAPALINTVLGREVFPQGTADTALIDAIAAALPQDEAMKLGAALPQELWGPLAARLEDAMKRKQEQEQEYQRVKLMSGREMAEKDPEADAAGDVIGSTAKRLKASNDD